MHTLHHICFTRSSVYVVDCDILTSDVDSIFQCSSAHRTLSQTQYIWPSVLHCSRSATLFLWLLVTSSHKNRVPVPGNFTSSHSDGELKLEFLLKRCMYTSQYETCIYEVAVVKPLASIFEVAPRWLPVSTESASVQQGRH